MGRDGGLTAEDYTYLGLEVPKDNKTGLKVAAASILMTAVMGTSAWGVASGNAQEVWEQVVGFVNPQHVVVAAGFDYGGDIGWSDVGGGCWS